MLSKLFKQFDSWMEGKLDEQEFNSLKYWLWFIAWFSWMTFYELVVVWGTIIFVLVIVFNFIKTEVIEEE